MTLTLTLTTHDRPEQSAATPGHWQVSECVTFRHASGGFHLRFGEWTDLPPVLTLLGVADTITRKHLPEMGQHPSMAFDVVYVTPDGIVDSATVEVTR